MPHHLGYALNGYSCTKAHRSEGMAGHVERQPFLNAASLAYYAKFGVYHTPAALTEEDKAAVFFFHRLLFSVFLLFFPTMVDNGLRYRMQRHNEFHLCLLAFLTDILPPVCCRLDMLI